MDNIKASNKIFSIEDAKKLKIQIIDQDQFFKMLNKAS